MVKLPKTVVPTSTNLFALWDVMKDDPNKVITRVEQVSVTHLKRCLAAGLFEPAPGTKGVRLSEAGHRAFEKEDKYREALKAQHAEIDRKRKEEGHWGRAASMPERVAARHLWARFPLSTHEVDLHREVRTITRQHLPAWAWFRETKGSGMTIFAHMGEGSLSANVGAEKQHGSLQSILRHENPPPQVESLLDDLHHTLKGFQQDGVRTKGLTTLGITWERDSNGEWRNHWVDLRAAYGIEPGPATGELRMGGVLPRGKQGALDLREVPDIHDSLERVTKVWSSEIEADRALSRALSQHGLQESYRQRSLHARGQDWEEWHLETEDGEPVKGHLNVIHRPGPRPGWTSFQVSL